MINWCDIPKDVAIKIVELFEFHEDFMSFGGVCTRWRSASKEAKFRACNPTKSLSWSSSMALPHDHRHGLPWLVVADRQPDDHHNDDDDDDDDDDDNGYCGENIWSLDKNNNRLIYNLCDGTITPLELPPIPCFYSGGELIQEGGSVLSSRGWLLSLAYEGTYDLNLDLLNPFSGEHIQLPPLEIYSNAWERNAPFMFDVSLIEKFILSSSPLSDDDEYSIALISKEPYRNLALKSDIVLSWKNGDDHWVQLEMLDINSLDFCSDVIFYRGEFYTVDNYGHLIAFGPGQACPCLVASFASLFSPVVDDYRPYPLSGRKMYHRLKLFYLVVSIDQLLLLCRVKELTKHHYYKTVSFQVYEVNVESRDANEVHNLGNRAVFVGTSSSFLVKASPYHGCKPNCIYYTDDYRQLDYQMGGFYKFNSRGKDSGIFNLTTGEVESSGYGSLCARVSGFTPPLWLESPASSSSITNFS